MILNTEHIRQKAHELALTHEPYYRRRPAKGLWRDFQASVKDLRSFVGSLQTGESSCSQPAEEWLLDHAEFIEEQILGIRQELTQASLRHLPHLRKDSQARILSICLDYTEAVDGNLDQKTLLAYVCSYQEVAVLTTAEAWLLPLFLRLALFRRLDIVMKQVRERREACAAVEKMLAGLEETDLTPLALQTALDEAGQEMPLSGPMIVHLLQHLREKMDDAATVQEWLLCKLENGPESFDRIVSYEYQLQATYQVTAGNIIGSLRQITRWDWHTAFEQISVVESSLREESTAVYPRLDAPSRDLLRKRVEILSRRLRLPENLIAQQAVTLATEAYEEALAEAKEEAGPDATTAAVLEKLPRRAFVAYYLLEADGMKKMRQALKMCSTPRHLPGLSILGRATGVYFSTLTILFAVILLGCAFWIKGNGVLTVGQWLLLLFALVLPVSEWAITAAHWLIERARKPQQILKYDFSSGVPPEAATMVVIPVIWSTVQEVQELAERLELHYLANRDEQIHFALLGDLVDADQEELPQDAAIIEAARAGIARLNQTYSRPKGSTFHFLQRRRLWNPAEGVWMGWERKRGKLVEFIDLLQGATNTTYSCLMGDRAVWGKIRYVITLDADTQLPVGTAQRLIGAMHLPYNRPRLNAAETRVVEGYGVLQPRIAISHKAAFRSRFAYLWSSNPGVDPYAFAASDPYQDGLGQGIFTGKGIFDVKAFAKVLGEHIPENRVLSHDLLEGGFLRTGLLSDIELIDEHPSTYRAHQKRAHRWVRGDWQLLIWLWPHVRNRQGVKEAVALAPLTRWQIVDNLRRSLFLPALFAVLLLTLTILPGFPARWLVLVLATLFLPLLRQLLATRWSLPTPRNLLATAGQVLLAIATMPFQIVLLLDAIGKTLYRLFISKRHLLEWISAAEVERRDKGKGQQLLPGIYGGYTLILIFALVAGNSPIPVLRWSGLGLAAVWLLAPLLVYWLDRPLQEAERPLEKAEEAELQELAEKIWHFFEDYVNEKENWLPPDNVQIDPATGVAHRTSPTNIGLYLAGLLAARDLGFIDTPGLITRLERTITTIERMEKWKGHLYNWYETTNLAPLPPLYVSTVDSGNFVGSLITVKEGLAEWLQEDIVGNEQILARRKGMKAPVVEWNMALAQELAPALPDGIEGYRQDWSEPSQENWSTRGSHLLNRLEALIQQTDFRTLYNNQSRLFHIGYQVALKEPDSVLYDLMASEARLSSFVAIALGQVPVSHWHTLGRTMTKIGRHSMLLSWSGTMFEYLMPWIFLRTYWKTVWDRTYRTVVKRQIDYAHRRGVPFGISESGYYAFDYRMNYQYRAFGVPGLGFKRGLEQDLVVAPYATIMALPFAKSQGLADLRKLRELGAYGKYGYYEAVDFTTERLPQGQDKKIIRSFMAHHQGMSLLVLANLLAPKKIHDRFHRNKQVRSAELLLQERMPNNPKVIRHPAALSRVPVPDEKMATLGSWREYPGANTAVPEVCVLSNGSLMSVITNSGSGLCRFEGQAVSRWREDPVLDNWGSYIYIRDVANDYIWSPSFQPCRVPGEEEQVRFSLERASFTRVDGDIHTGMEICVSPEWNAEVRRLTLTNAGSEIRVIEVTTFLELALNTPMADEAHPVFSKMFLKTDYDPESQCLLAGRQPRRADERPLWAAHSLLAWDSTIGPLEYETDRACFIGRGHTLARPQGITSRLRGTVGTVSDPAFIMRRRFSINPGEKVQLLAVTAVGATREEAVEIVGRFDNEMMVERTLQMAWNRSLIELRHLQLNIPKAMTMQILAGRVLYQQPLRPEQQQSIMANEKGQAGLWAYGISGDLPIVLVGIEQSESLPFIVQLLSGHEYLRRLGLAFDLVILNESGEGYQQDLHDAIRRTMEQVLHWQKNGASGVFIINAGQLAQADRIMLRALAKVTLRSNGPSLRAQIRPLKRERTRALPAPAPVFSQPRRDYCNLQLKEEQPPIFFNGWGGFMAGGREYRILLKKEHHLLAPWINVLANPNFGCLISEIGTGYTWWRNSREYKLTPWSNDPILDQPGELCYLRDEENGAVWFAAGPPGVECAATHGHGFTRLESLENGIKGDLTVFVPLTDSVKLLQLRLRNETETRRVLSITYYAEWIMGVQRQKNAPYIVTEWEPTTQTLLANNAYQELFREATAFLGLYQQETEGVEEWYTGLSWTADRDSFIGRNGTMENPVAMQQRKLSGKTGVNNNSCGAVQGKLALEPGEEKTVYILLGCADNRKQALSLAQKYSQGDVCTQAFAQTRDGWQEILSQITVSTPSLEMDLLLNGWLLYQTLACRMWARAGFYQAGGAYGFRDQLQDALALLHTRPELTRNQILIHAAHQYEEGDVQHWWHEETGRGIRTRFSDDLLWLSYVTGRYVDHTEDLSILEEIQPFLNSAILAEDEEERYEMAQVSTASATLWEHCLRAIERSLSSFGEHGLPLIGGGDWNDGLNKIGLAGRGESVWLGWFLCSILDMFADLSQQRGETQRSERYAQTRAQLVGALEEHGWDGQWYRRAFTDSGEWLGSIYNNECRIDALAQSWPVISEAASLDRKLQAMQSFERELVDRDACVARLLTPPFADTVPDPGYIQSYPPGIRENGAQYNHGIIWGIIAWCKLGRGDKAFELFQLLNPLNHTKTMHEARQYVGEPYVMAADVCTVEPRQRRAGWTWYTGAAGWMYQAGVEWILGLQRHGQKLFIRPCIPEDWPGFSVQYRFGSAQYHITVENDTKNKSGQSDIFSVDGREVPVAEQSDLGPAVTLQDDGQVHQVKLVL